MKASPSISGRIAGQLAYHRLARDPAAKPRADDALVHEGLIRAEQTHRREHRHHRARACSARRSVDFGIGKDRHVPQVRVVGRRRPGEDGSVDATKLRLVGVDDLHRGLDRVLDRHADAPELAQLSWSDRQASGFGIHNRVECAAKRHVGADLAATESKPAPPPEERTTAR